MQVIGGLAALAAHSIKYFGDKLHEELDRCIITDEPLNQKGRPAIVKVIFPTGREQILEGLIHSKVRKGRKYRDGRISSVRRGGVKMTIHKTESGIPTHATFVRPAI